LDALLSIVQMPGGVPVACMAIGAAGARNAALMAAQILGLKHDAVRRAYEEYKRGLAGG
jgi:5-(carboxyamino)imidazole ribonucleotide mutase